EVGEAVVAEGVRMAARAVLLVTDRRHVGRLLRGREVWRRREGPARRQLAEAPRGGDHGSLVAIRANELDARCPGWAGQIGLQVLCVVELQLREVARRRQMIETPAFGGVVGP